MIPFRVESQRAYCVSFSIITIEDFTGESKQSLGLEHSSLADGPGSAGVGGPGERGAVG